jgi:pSer/pThr/pTyr-binding forkhead associated (FHA) protein
MGERGGVFCSNCGHQNLPGANFCSSCGEPLVTADVERTLVLHPVDPGQDAPGTGDDVVVELDELPAAVGVLIVRSGPQAGMRIVLDKDNLALGRHPDSDVVFDDITVSRRHAEVERVADGYVVRDVGSLNGTYLNQERVEWHPLVSGDELQIGKFRMVFLAAPEGTS